MIVCSADPLTLPKSSPVRDKSWKPSGMWSCSQCPLRSVTHGRRSSRLSPKLRVTLVLLRFPRSYSGLGGRGARTLFTNLTGRLRMIQGLLAEALPPPRPISAFSSVSFLGPGAFAPAGISSSLAWGLCPPPASFLPPWTGRPRLPRQQTRPLRRLEHLAVTVLQQQRVQLQDLLFLRHL